MGDRYLTDLADVVRGAGLEVVETQGWQTRARGSGGFDGNRPWCVMWHHTASSTTPQNDVSYIISGCPDAPVANLYLARDGTVWVCAGGATNTNGKGGPEAFSRGTVPVDQMNTHAIGIEAANAGTGEVWPAEQIDAYFRLSLALCAAYGLAPVDVCTHNQWAPDRKIDPATADAVQGAWRPGAVTSAGTWSLEDIRAELTARAQTSENDDMTPEQAAQLSAIYGATNATNENIWGGDNNDPPYDKSIYGRLDHLTAQMNQVLDTLAAMTKGG